MQVMRFSDVIAADKFAYLPSVGLLMILAWFLCWLCYTDNVGKAVVRRIVVVIIVLILAGAEAVATRRYLVHWRDTVSLYEHMLTVPQMHRWCTTTWRGFWPHIQPQRCVIQIGRFVLLSVQSS